MNEEKRIVTTKRRPRAALVALAERAARELGAEYAPRGALSIEALARSRGAQVAVVATERGFVAHTAAGALFFHLNMAQLRIKNLLAGQNDHMADAMGLAPGLTVLDCTAGLAADAVVASFLVGAAGAVTGLEASPVTALIAREGLARERHENREVEAAMRRVRIVCADALAFLAAQPDRSADVVYFDPMFRRPVEESVHLAPLRPLADARSLSEAAVREARRVARRRVVLKEANGSGEFARLGFTKTVGGKYSSVQFGVIELG